jgi:hypothetical protein
MRTSIILALALLASNSANAAHKREAVKPPPAAAASRSAAKPAQQLSLTIYNNDLVMVQDIRTLDLPAGRSRIAFPDVSAAIRPETVSLTSKGLSVVEQNFDYDLLTPAKMMEKQVGRDVQIVRTNPATGAQATETATVLSVNSGVVLRIGSKIEALRDDGLPTRVVFDSIPENLRASPTLSVTVDAGQAGPRPVNLSYLASGISWSAAYVGMYDEKRGSLNLQGWVTVKNSSGTSFRDADAELVAGSVNTTSGNGGGNYYGNTARVTPGTAAQQGAKPLSDLYTYRLPEHVTVANQQTKQIAFLDLGDARATKHYNYEASYFSSAERAQPAVVGVDFSNGSEAIPAGTVRLYMRDTKGDPKFIGEQFIGHVPAGSDIGIEIGDAFDVTVQPLVVSSETRQHGARYEMKYIVRNARPDAVTVDLVQDGLGGGDIEHESQKSVRIDANRAAWDVRVPAQGETTLTATIETGS